MTNDDMNPYAAPVVAEFAGPPVPRVDVNSEGVWRDGKTVILHRQGKLPPYCVKTGKPVSDYQWIKRKISWHPPWVFILIVIGLLFYVVGALVTRKTATIHLGISDEAREARRNGMLIAWGIALFGFALFIVSLFVGNDAFVGVSVLLGIVMALVALVYGSRKAGLLRPTKMDDQYIWLSGACPEFLALLPERG